MNNTETRTVRLSVNWIFVAAIFLILLAAIWQIRAILMLIFAANMLVIFCSIPVRWLVGWQVRVWRFRIHVGRAPAIILALLLLFLLLIVPFSLVLPTLFVQFASLATEVIPQGVEQAVDYYQSGQIFVDYPWLEGTLEDVDFNERVINQAIGQIGNALSQLGGSVLPFVGGVANVLLSTLIILFISAYLLADPQVYINRVIMLTPLWYRQRMREILDRMDGTVRSWIGVTIASMIVTGVGTALGLWLLGIEEWIALGVLAGFASFIPNFGSVIALVPALAVGVVEMPQNILWIVVIIYVVSFLQSQIVAPILTNESMNLPPVFVLVGQIVFGFFFGFLGIMFAVPLTALLLVLIDEIYVKDILGDRPDSTVTSPDDPDAAAAHTTADEPVDEPLVRNRV